MVAVGLAGCGDDVTIVEPPPPPPPPAPTVKSISVAPNPGSVPVGGTITMSAAVVADAGVATTVTWSSSDATKATVNAASGVVTGVAAGSVAITATSTVNPSVQGNATVNVTAAPTATVTGVTVTPGTAGLIVGQTVQLSASVQGTNNPAQTVTWSSLSAGIASVSAGGLVTGVANGTAVIRGCSTATGFTNVCGSMSVTVSTPTPASISIQSLTTGNLGVPVNLNSVMGQIEASVNVEAGGQTLDRVDVLIGGVVVASQSFAVTPAPSEEDAAGAPVTVVLSFNTTQLRQVNGLFVPVVFNGQKAVTANLYVVGSSTPLASNAIPVVMNNPDQAIAPASLTTAPGALSFVNGGVTWFKSGLATSFTYLSYSTITPTSAAATLNAACGTAAGTITGVAATGITSNRTWDCASTEGTRSITALGAIAYPAGSVGPDGSTLTAATQFSTVGGQYIVAGNARWNLITPTPNALPGPVAVDNLGPTVAVATIAFNAAFDQAWINASYDLLAQITPTDGGSGVASKSARLFSAACGATDLPVPHALAETITSTSTDGYRICGRAVDNLGNVGTSGASNYFGVDVVAPVIRLAGSTAATPALVTPASVSSTANTSIYSIASPFVATDKWGIEGLDTRSGFNQNVVTGFPAIQTMTFLAPTGTLACGFTGAMSTLMSDTYVRTAVLPALDCGSGLPGYYTYNGRAVDRAGNTSTTIARNFAVDQYAVPQLTGLGFAQALYTADAPASFGISANDDLEIIEGTLALFYNPNNAGPSEFVLRYPYGSLNALGVRWDGAPLTNILNGAALTIDKLVIRIDTTIANLPSGGYATAVNATPDTVSVNVRDVASQPAAAALQVPMLTTQFTGITAPWASAPTAVFGDANSSWSAAVVGSNIVATQRTGTSVTVPYFDRVVLWGLNGAGELVRCGEFAAPALTDNGTFRIWTYTMATPTGASNPCTGSAGWRVAGMKSGAALMTSQF